MSSEGARRNKYCPDKSKRVSLEETEDKKFTDKTKVSEVIEEVFEKQDKPKNVFVEETVDKKFFFFYKTKASEFLEEVFVKCDNCGEIFKTTQCLKDYCDHAHQSFPKSHKYKCDQCDYQNNNEKGLKQLQKMKHNSLKYIKKKVGSLFKCGTCEKAEITLEGLYYHNKHSHNNKQHFELYMPV